MIIVCPLHAKTDAARMRVVKAEMRRRGAPTLHGFVDEERGIVLLREGTHRINAAAIIGEVPRIVPIRWWRSPKALAAAHHAARERGILFDTIQIVHEETMSKRPTTDLTSWPEGALRGCARHAERPEVRARAAAELERRTQKPWLSGAEKIIFAINLLAVLGLASIAFWLSGCAFPEEGVPVDTCPDCYRPPHDPGHHIDPRIPDASTSDGSRSSVSAWDEESSGDDGTSGPVTSGASTTTDATTEGTESSSTGEAPYEPAHCDAFVGDPICPDDATQIVAPDDEVHSCYCASPCASDDDCAPHEWCDPFFSACTVWCDSVNECARLDAVMTCTLWWIAPDNWTRLCSYPNEAP